MKTWKMLFAASSLLMMAGCGADGDNGVDGSAGEPGVAGESCTATALKDGSGYTLTCGEKEVGVIKNGENGGDGKNGINGSSCTKTKDEDGVVEITCGTGKDAVVSTLYKAMCGETPYDPADKFCLGTTLYEKCNGETYDVTKQFCDSRGEGRLYKFVNIGDQTWMAENLNYKPTDEDLNYDPADYEGDQDPKMMNPWYGCYGEGDGFLSDEKVAANCVKYGRLYTWDFANSSCPDGWRLPTSDEFHVLLKNLDSDDEFIASTKLKSTSGWVNDDGEDSSGDDAYGFNALPAGFKEHYDRSKRGDTKVAWFDGDGWTARFWSGTNTENNANYLIVVNRASVGEDTKHKGFSVRCIKDSSK